MNLRNFHSWLYSACPAPADVLLRELELGHRTAKAEYAGLPATAAELSAALRELERDGLLSKRGSDWHWLAEPVKVEPQGVLFA